MLGERYAVEERGAVALPIGECEKAG